ncbi:SusC/RagA family TonB-linked outer membrane protein [Lacihabitans soyangensis]|uniref:TonB-dependent receptor n=1 Tax=Lacihabitans soyangensis TaxID=869394 RepID=A0AAE3KWG6_9BACT|nr:TonB-dependent receptor [Lacihabitans soyangensis]MCP9765681.1 TonB-dependent receptor [Lacihabitans soyangensis]
MNIKRTLYFCLLIFYSTLNTIAQRQKIVTGKVTDKAGEGLPGVTIRIKDTQFGTSTNAQGEYSLNITDLTKTLVATSIGYITTEVAVGNRSTIDIILKSNNQELLELVVVGYGTAKKSDLTGSVSSMKSEQINQIATPNVGQALQGRMAGVDVSAESGEPGSGARIRIRGVGTINNSDPLYVVDGFQTGDISFLAPGDIESIEVLKDASATAIYGSRGANGVVLISTKRGKKTDKPKFSFEAYSGFQQSAKIISMLNATDYATLRLEAFENDKIVLPTDNNIFNRLNYIKSGNYNGTNWQNEVMNSGAKISNYSVNVLGGNEINRYSITGTIFDQEGLIKNSGMKKYFLRFNNDVQLRQWLNSGLSVAFSRFDKTFYNSDLYSGVLTTALAADPITASWDRNTNNWGRADMSSTNNPARSVNELINNKGYGSLINGNVFIEAKFLKNFTFRSQMGINYNNSHNKSYSPKFFVSTDEARDNSSLWQKRGEFSQWVLSNYVTFNKDLKQHSFGIMAGTESQQSQYSDMEVTAYDVPNDATQFYLSAAKNARDYTVKSNQSDESILSYFGRLNYNFAGKYLLTGTLRRDGSSRFLGANRWGTFPSFAAAWNLTEESFLKDVSAIDHLKIRVGWGQVGNQNSADNYGYVTTMVGNNLYTFNGQTVSGFAPEVASNKELKWETTTSSNFGIDFSLLKNKLSFTADYFIKTTNDMIVAVPIPTYSGIGAAKVNAGSVENKGIELALSYSNKEGELKYEVTGNLTKINNTVTSLGGGTAIESGNISKVGNTTITEVSREIAVFYGYKTNGIFQSTEELKQHINSKGEALQDAAQVGDVRFVDLNQDGIIDSKDRTYLGSGTPDFSYGFTTNFNYKNFDLRFFFQGVKGAEIVNGLTFTNQKGNLGANLITERLNRWTATNPSTNEPRVTEADPNNNYRFSDRYVQDGSYLRFKNITLGYSLPASILAKIKIHTLRLYASGDNILTITKYKGYDPEVGSYYNNSLAYGVDVANYPTARTLRLGLNAGF